MSESRAIVTGSFDPITLGHLEIIKYASERYDIVYVVALINDKKKYMFTMEQKRRLIEITTKSFSNVIVDSYEGLTADYMHSHNIYNIVRGARNEADVLYENELALAMKGFDLRFETEIVRLDGRYDSLSSTIVRSKILNGESIDGLVHRDAIIEIKKMLEQK